MKILYKISGEALGDLKKPWRTGNLKRVIAVLEILKNAGHAVVVVVGGGNIWRYRDHVDMPLPRVESDFLGMLATVFNANCLKSSAEHAGMNAVVFSRVKVADEVAIPYSRAKVQEAMREGKLVFLAGGTGQSGFSTDTGAALAAVDLGCDEIWKATKVDGVYSADPLKHKHAKHIAQISYAEFLAKDLRVMDASAVEICAEKKIPIRVYQFCLRRTKKLVQGQKVGSLIS